MTDPDQQALQRFLADLILPSYVTDPRLTLMVTAKQTYLSIKHGYSNASAVGYVMYGVSLQMFDRVTEALAFG